MRQLRTAKGLSQEALADQSEIDRTYVSLLERGLKNPTLGTMLGLCKSLDVSLVNFAGLIEMYIRYYSDDGKRQD